MIAVITGASSGIGNALAHMMLAQGHTVIGAARRVTADEWCEVVDVSDEQQCNAFIDRGLHTHGHIDVLVNNAGRGNYASIEDTTTELWREMFSVNVDSMFWLTKRVLPVMRSKNAGHIINIASVAGRMGFPYNAAYIAAKHAVVGFTAALRAELIGTNVNATVVSPAGVITEWQEATVGGSMNALYARAIPRSRVKAREQELALAPLFKLMSAEQVSEIILQTIANGRSNDVFTHVGSDELAVQAITDRITLEDRHRALFLSMHEVYKEDHG